MLDCQNEPVTVWVPGETIGAGKAHYATVDFPCVAYVLVDYGAVRHTERSLFSVFLESCCISSAEGEANCPYPIDIQRRIGRCRIDAVEGEGSGEL